MPKRSSKRVRQTQVSVSMCKVDNTELSDGEYVDLKDATC